MRQTELRRTAFKRTMPIEKKPPPGPRKRKCRICKEHFIPRSTTHIACKPECAHEAAKRKREALARRDDRLRKKKLKTRSMWLREAQQVFNSFIRFRDMLAGYPCISSGRPLDWSGNQTDAGHFRSVGSAPHLRFNEDNVHAQSKHDNQFLSGNAVEYRIGLIARIGLDRVEALESDNAARKWTIEELMQIRDEYRLKLKKLKEGN